MFARDLIPLAMAIVLWVYTVWSAFEVGRDFGRAETELRIESCDRP